MSHPMAGYWLLLGLIEKKREVCVLGLAPFASRAEALVAARARHLRETGPINVFPADHDVSALLDQVKRWFSHFGMVEPVAEDAVRGVARAMVRLLDEQFPRAEKSERKEQRQ